VPQVVPAPCHAPEHCANVVTEHPVVPVVGSTAQHAPVTGVGLQSVVVQTVLLPLYTPPVVTAHWASVEIRQSGPAKPEAQHAPVAGAGLQTVFGVELPQVDPTPCQTPPAVLAHCASVPTTHGTKGAVEAVRQHAPLGVVTRHDALVHDVPAPNQCPCAAAHAISVVTVQETAPFGLGAQHAPCPYAVSAAIIATRQHSAAALFRSSVRPSMEASSVSSSATHSPEHLVPTTRRWTRAKRGTGERYSEYQITLHQFGLSGH
jgi:hypothetical protein